MDATDGLTSPPAAAPSSADALTRRPPCDRDSGTAHTEGATAVDETLRRLRDEIAGIDLAIDLLADLEDGARIRSLKRQRVKLTARLKAIGGGK